MSLLDWHKSWDLGYDSEIIYRVLDRSGSELLEGYLNSNDFEDTKTPVFAFLCRRLLKELQRENPEENRFSIKIGGSYKVFDGFDAKLREGSLYSETFEEGENPVISFLCRQLFKKIKKDNSGKSFIVQIAQSNGYINDWNGYDSN